MQVQKRSLPQPTAHSNTQTNPRHYRLARIFFSSRACTEPPAFFLPLVAAETLLSGRESAPVLRFAESLAGCFELAASAVAVDAAVDADAADAAGAADGIFPAEVDSPGSAADPPAVAEPSSFVAGVAKPSALAFAESLLKNLPVASRCMCTVGLGGGATGGGAFLRGRFGRLRRGAFHATSSSSPPLPGPSSSIA